MLDIPRRVALLLALLASLPAQATPPRPTLVVAISVDQLSGDLFNEYRAHFSGGLKRLADGVVFTRGYQSHAATETCPGHATLLTGARPARNGIIANHWFDQGLARDDKQVYCVEDAQAPGSSSRQYQVSTRHLRVPTLGMRMKAATPATRVVSVAGKDRAAVLLAGADADQTWWWGGAGFVSYPQAKAPAALTAVNTSVRQQLGEARAPLPLPAFCKARDYPVALRDGQQVGSGRFAREAGDAKAFRASPALDAATLTLAGALFDALALGKGPHTDLLAIGLSATDLIGHAYGTEGSEMCVQLAALDAALGEFFARLDARGIEYLVMLSADHGGHDAPERAAENAIVDAARVDDALLPAALGERIAARLKLSTPVLLGDGANGDVYLARHLDAAQRRAVSDAAVQAWQQHPQVAAVFTRDELLAQPSPHGPPDQWSLVQEARASFDAERSGDFVVLLKARVTPIASAAPGYVATHGSPWDYDRRVPILFWRRGLAGFEQPNAVETVDILPTLAAQIGLQVPAAEIDGRCLDLTRGVESSCASR
jgi:predicted AlkP superfamily pyrophosphatase or phosphodiesterase